MEAKCTETVKRTGKICGRKTLHGSTKCGYHHQEKKKSSVKAPPPPPPAAPVNFQAEMSLKNARRAWSELSLADVGQLLPFAATETRFNLADMIFIL